MLVFVALIAVVIIGYITVGYIQTLKQEQRKKAGAKAGVLAFIAGLILLTVTGKLYILAALGTGLIVLAKRLFPFLRYFPLFQGLFQKAKAKKSSGTSKHSSVETSLLKMTLDHESGEIDGELLDTVSEGKYLSEFELPDLISLYILAGKQYPDSTEILATYLDRKYGTDWREAANAENSSQESGQNARESDNSEMTVIEAYAVLGLDNNATEEEIIAAHRKLMLKLHPDKGGSNYLATKINQAKDLLVSNKNK
jgi:hypothetical protein